MSIKRLLFWLTIFSISMAYIESATVVYLQELYYPDGFSYPLKPMTDLFYDEIGREVATILMLLSVGVLAGRTSLQKFAWFLFCFGVWDIFYYIWLVVLKGWPTSLFTRDILFLIPVAWVGPVLAPVICSLGMMMLAGMILHVYHRGYKPRVKTVEWVVMLSGVFVLFINFIWEYSSMIIANGYWSNFFNLLQHEPFLEEIATFVPDPFNWPVFIIGCLITLVGMLIFYVRTLQQDM